MSSPSMRADKGNRGGPTSVDIPPDTEHFEPNSHWKDAPNHVCYSSFGDNGTTATVNAYGDIMQFSKYIGKGHSGMFSADHQYVSEPYLVEKRTADLQNLIGQSSHDEKTFYGAQFPGLTSLFGPELTYVHNRWPRFDDVLEHDWQRTAQEFDNFQKFEDLRAHLRSEFSGLSRFSTTWMVHNGIVFQHCIASNNSRDVDLPIKIQFEENMLIRDLDHLDPNYSSNKEMNDNYSTFLGPQQQSWVQLRELHRALGEKNPERQSNDEVTTDSVAVVVSVFINNQLQTWTRTATDTATDNATDNATVSSLSDTPSNSINAETKRDEGRPEEGKFEWSHTVAPRDEVEITFAYEMSHTQESSDKMGNPFDHIDGSLIKEVQYILGGKPVEGTLSFASLFPVTDETAKITEENIIPHLMFQSDDEMEENESEKPIKSDARSASRLENPSGEIPTTTPLNHLIYFARRNLEHILSVCAIPIDSDDKRIKGLKKQLGVYPIALTCGDMAFHRVNTSASFFAFEFLIETARRLRHSSIANHKQAKSLLNRVQRVCIGHLLWLISITQETQPFAANYWVSGTRMTAMQTESWQPKDSLINSAYQWIKIHECVDVFGDVLGVHTHDLLVHLMPSARAWQEQLKSLDVRAACAWPHSREDATNIFRLDDHIWIWKGLRAIEEMESLQRPKDWMTSQIYEIQRLEDSRKRASKNIQQQVIRHFTIKDVISGERTLAVTRSSRENRFLFHSRDTVLLYARDWGFIPDWDAISVEVWKNAMRVQPDHDENHEFTWENALRYALSILMGLEGFSINKKPFSDVVKDSLATLVQSSSPTGLFVGLLERTTKNGRKSIREHERDFHFHAGFEISYILFRNAHKIINSFKQQTSPYGKRKDVSQAKLTEIDHLIAQSITQHTLKDQLQTNSTSKPDIALVNSHRSPAHTPRTKKSMPINSSTNANNVVDVDDEWLYNYPRFLVRSSKTPNSEDSRSHPFTGAGHKDVKTAPIKSPKNEAAAAAAVFDIAKKKLKGEKQKGPYKDPRMLTAGGLQDRLNSPRTPESSKKRFVWLTSQEKSFRDCCHLSSHDDDKAAMLQFFDNNVKALHYFRDATNVYLNTWDTELHISFYQVRDSNQPHSSDKDSAHANQSAISSNDDQSFTKASMGFHFSGDFFDRFWTCHFLESTTTKHDRWNLWLEDTSKRPRENQMAWGQRKVLELHLFERILAAVVKSTKELLEHMKPAVDGTGEQREYNAYLTSGQRQNLQQKLKAVIGELDRVNEIIVRWRKREADRGIQRPRWTSSDESKYRVDITNLENSIHRDVQKFRNLRSQMKSLRERLTSHQEQTQQTREEIEFRNSENIKYFTYVTVVFLPLGFATSIFSMSGAPEQDLVRRMATIAIIALMVTVLAIMIAQKIKPRFNQKTENMVKHFKKDSILFRLNVESNASDTWIWFWYILAELPSQIVVSAYDRMSRGDISIMTFFNVVIGIIVLPWCLIALMTRIIVFNAVDGVSIISSLIFHTFANIFVSQRQPRKRLEFLLEPSGILRPLKTARAIPVKQGKKKAI